MENVTIGTGSLLGKGIYAARDFTEREVVIEYHLKPLSDEEYVLLPESEKNFVHTHGAQKFLYAEPERYVNHSPNPNTYQDLKRKCDVALRDI